MAYGDQPRPHLRARGVGARVRLRRGGGGEGHEVPAVVHASTPDTVWDNYGLTADEARAAGHEQPHVQLVPRRHEVGHRDWPQSPTRPPHAAARRPRASRPAAGTTSRTCCGRPRPAASSTTRDRSRWCRRLSATAGRCPATCAGASTSSRGAERLHCGLLPQYGMNTRRDRSVLGHVQAVPPDRARAERVGPRGRAAREADRRRGRLRRRHRRDGEARPLRRGRRSTARAGSPSTGSCSRRGRRSSAGRCRSASPTMPV